VSANLDPAAHIGKGILRNIVITAALGFYFLPDCGRHQILISTFSIL